MLSTHGKIMAVLACNKDATTWSFLSEKICHWCFMIIDEATIQQTHTPFHQRSHIQPFLYSTQVLRLHRHEQSFTLLLFYERHLSWPLPEVNSTSLHNFCILWEPASFAMICSCTYKPEIGCMPWVVFVPGFFHTNTELFWITVILDWTQVHVDVQSLTNIYKHSFKILVSDHKQASK